MDDNYQSLWQLLFGPKAMVFYLFDVTSFDGIQPQDRLELLRVTVHSELYGKLHKTLLFFFNLKLLFHNELADS